jgi:DNA (cytosine-5)-methyltransferase 1
MTHGSLFSGIGGFDLAAEWMGWENKFHCEWNTFGQKVLHHYWPQAEQFTDITKTDFTKYANRIDILTGGFPCQPYSSAGKRLGKEDERHLWPEMLRAIREIQPRWVVGENVLGLVNWSGGLVFHEVQTDLEAEGYEVQPYVLPAVSVNAPHRRDRVWFVAYSTRFNNGTNKLRGLRCENGEIEGEGSQTIHNAFRSDGIKGITSNTNSNGFNQRNSDNEINPSERGVNALGNINESNVYGNAADTLSIRLQQCENGTEMGRGQGEMGRERSQPTNAIETNGEVQYTTDTKCSNLENKWNEQRGLGEKNSRQSSRGFKHGVIQNNWHSFPTTEPTIRSGDDGIPNRLDSITFPKWRNESIKAGGNAIVPQVVLQIFKTIEQYERINTSDKNS